MNSNLSRRKLISGTGAMASALAAPILLMRPSEAAAASCELHHGRAYSNSSGFVDDFLKIPRTTCTFKTMCGSDILTERGLLAIYLRGASSPKIFVGANVSRFFKEPIVQVHTYSTRWRKWLMVYEVTGEKNSRLAGDEHRFLQNTDTPWVLAAGSTARRSQSSGTIGKFAGWKVFVKASRPGITYCRYWVWNAIFAKYEIKENELVNNGIYLNYEFHKDFTNTCNLFTNRIGTLITAAASLGAGATAALVVAIESGFRENTDDATDTTFAMAKYITAVIATLAILGFIHYDAMMACQGYGETLFAQFVKARYVS
jgi:hypothetical protein